MITEHPSRKVVQLDLWNRWAYMAVICRSQNGLHCSQINCQDFHAKRKNSRKWYNTPFPSGPECVTFFALIQDVWAGHTQMELLLPYSPADLIVSSRKYSYGLSVIHGLRSLCSFPRFHLMLYPDCQVLFHHEQSYLKIRCYSNSCQCLKGVVVQVLNQTGT